MHKTKQLVLLVLFGVLGVPLVLFAQTDIQQIADAAGSSTDLAGIIGRIIRVILGLLGVILLGLMIYAGILWMTAGGDSTKVDKAKQTMVRAVVGFVIVLVAYAIVAFIMNALGIGGFGSGDRDRPTGPGAPPFSDSLGNAGLLDHFPMRDQRGVPRNTRVMVTFKGVVSPSVFIEGYDDGGTPGDISDDEVPQVDPNCTVTDDNDCERNFALRSGIVDIYRTDLGTDAALYGDAVQVGFSIIDTQTVQTSTFVFRVPLLDGEENYSVKLSDAIRDITGKELIKNGGYLWVFTTSNEIDVTPPQVQSARPAADGTWGRNILVQITFNEAMDPTSVSGLFSATDAGQNFNNIIVSDKDGSVDGVFALSNGYRTVTYFTNDQCGVNACGQPIFCLPASQKIEVTVISPDPDVNNAPRVPDNQYPALGATDVAGNALDGNNDGVVVAGNIDNYKWEFQTNNQIVLTGPVIESVFPSLIDPSNVALDSKVQMYFNGMLDAASLPGSIFFRPTPSHELPFWIRLEESDNKQTVEIKHGVLLKADVGGTAYTYDLLATEGIRNEYQNCFAPASGPKTGTTTCATSTGGVPDAVSCCVPTDDQPYCCDGSLSSAACTTRE